MIIRPEKEAEFPALYDFVKTSFETAKVSNGDEQNFVNRLRAGPNYIPALALVAEKEGEIIGHIMLTHTAIETTGGPFPLLLLAPIAVALAQRGQKIATKLIEDSFARARAMGHAAVILVGDPEFYTRYGFKPAIDFGIENGNGIPNEYVMACELFPGALNNAKGKITFQT